MLLAFWFSCRTQSSSPPSFPVATVCWNDMMLCWFSCFARIGWHDDSKKGQWVETDSECLDGAQFFFHSFGSCSDGAQFLHGDGFKSSRLSSQQQAMVGPTCCLCILTLFVLTSSLVCLLVGLKIKRPVYGTVASVRDLSSSARTNYVSTKRHRLVCSCDVTSDRFFENYPTSGRHPPPHPSIHPPIHPSLRTAHTCWLSYRGSLNHYIPID